jgi:hypothetical protein
MNNQVANPEYQSTLNRMQELYDTSLMKWKEECIEEGNYHLYAKIYDRHMPWDEKVLAMDSRMKRLFLEWREADSKLTSSGAPKEVSPEKRAAKAAARAKRKAEQEANQ